ncbi:MAG: murD, partial [Mucilaginibacter sp.]|nr:murD [Mucilaginibacter sp.]
MNENKNITTQKFPRQSVEAGRVIVILGAAESGVGAAYLAQQQGYEVFVSDFGVIAGNYKKQLQGWNIRFEENGHTEAEILKATEV